MRSNNSQCGIPQDDSYQWYYQNPSMKNFDLSSNISASYSYSMQSYMAGRQVYRVITDAYGSTVEIAPVTVQLK